MLQMSDIKGILFQRLLDEHCFWSYDMSEKKATDIPDEVLISKVLEHLDMSEINMLIFYYGKKFVKRVWREQLVIQGDYYFTLNRFLAWYYFGIKRPDQYIKTVVTKHINSFV